MFGESKSLVLAMVACAVIAIGAPTLRADVNLEWRPAWQEAIVGDMVSIDLYAVSDDESLQPFGVLEAILLWDPGELRLLGYSDDGPYAWFSSGFPFDEPQDGLNAPFGGGVPGNDGDAWYNALSQFVGDPASATPDGLLITRFQFEVLSTGTALLQLPATFGKFTQTRVLDDEIGGLIITGTLGPPAVVDVVEAIPTVSGWGNVIMALLALTAGTIAFRSIECGIRP